MNEQLIQRFPWMTSYSKDFHERAANPEISVDDQLIKKISVDDYILKIFTQIELLCKCQSHNKTGHNSTYSVSD